MHNAMQSAAQCALLRTNTPLHKHTTRWSWRSIDSLRTEGGGGGGAGRANNQYVPIAVILIHHLALAFELQKIELPKIANGQDSLGDFCAYKWSVAQDKPCECQM